jgi:hypothetical protein
MESSKGGQFDASLGRVVLHLYVIANYGELKEDEQEANRAFLPANIEPPTI